MSDQPDYETAARSEGWSTSVRGDAFVDSDGNYFTDETRPEVVPSDPQGWMHLCVAEGIEPEDMAPHPKI